MSPAHDTLVAALTSMLARLQNAEAVEAGDEVAALEALARATPAPLSDARVGPLFEACVREADALRLRLALQVRDAGTSARAAAAYDEER